MKRPFKALRAVVLALAAALAFAAPIAKASDGYYLTGVHVTGGDVWHAENAFQVEWDPNPPGTEPVHFGVRTSTGLIISGYFEETTSDSLFGGIHVPPIPGVYLLEIWNQRGQNVYGPDRVGPPVKVPLYFDDAHPGAVTIAAPGWIAAGDDVIAAIAPPRGAPPVSGIAGYAVTIDARADGLPCARVGRCGGGEISLAGPSGGPIRFRSPPEGISYVHAVAVSGSGMASSDVASTRIAVDGSPPEVHLEGAPAGWAAGPVRVTAVATDPLSGMAAAGPDGPVTALSVDGSPPQIVPGAAASATVSGESTHRLEFYGRDAIGNSGDGSLPFAGPGSATVRIDESGPSVRFAAPDPTDPERIEATVADPLSGPDPDRGLIEVRGVGSSSRFQPLPTAADRGRLVARWPSDDYARGAYEFRATAYDAVGNPTTSTLAGAGGAFVLQNPVKREARLAFGFGTDSLVFPRCSRADGSRTCHRTVVRSFAQRPPARTLPCCHGAMIGGRLVDVGGTPLAGQTVAVIETYADGGRVGSRRTELITDGDGRFSTRLTPGPSREVTAEFAGTRHLGRARGRSLALRVRAAVHLRVSTARVEVGGAPVVFSGRIAHPEAAIPAGGMPVELEFRLPGMPWTEFRTVQSDALGRFRFPYSFSDDDSAGVRFLFRAFVPAGGGWPFAPATSRPLAVIG